MVEKGANMELQDEEGFSPLLTACWTTKDEMVAYLLEKKARMDVFDKYKRSAVHLAVLRKSESVLQLLCKAGAPLNLMTGTI